MSECSNGVSQQCAEINTLNFKIGADRYAALMAQGSEDNQGDSRGWSNLRLKQATDAQVVADFMSKNAAAVSHFINMGSALAGQIGVSEGQQLVSPAGTSASEAIKGAIGTAAVGEAVSAEAITANVANLFTALTPVIASALAAAISQTISALVPVVVTASGGASTPSQTTPKSAA